MVAKIASSASLSLLTMPQEVRIKMLNLSADLQAKCRARITAINALAAAPAGDLKRTALRLEAELAAGLGRGFAARSLLNLYRDYRRHGAEVILFEYGRRAEKPVEFLRELARRAGNNKRVTSVELQNLRADWFAGREVKGYGTWRAHWEKTMQGEPLPEKCPVWFIPAGMGERNLRRYLPGKTALTLARQGYFAAHGKLPQKPNDYSALRPLEVVVFDDVRMDFLVSYPGHAKPVEMWLLVAMDMATRCILDWVSLAAVPDDEGKRAALLEEHMRVLTGAILQRYGVPGGWTMTLKVENAKATLRDSDSQMLGLLSGGQVIVEKTKMHTRVLPNGYTERHGSPWEKPIEVFFNSLHNHTAALPGHIGARYDLAPAELNARRKEHEALMKEAAGLPAEITGKLNLGFLRYEEAVDALLKVFDFLNNRTRHALKGFDEVEVFRFPEDNDFRPIEDLRRYPVTEVRRAIIDRRMESPLERMDKLLRAAPPFIRVPEDALVPFMARTVKRVRHPAPFTIAWSERGTKFEYRGEIEVLRTGDADAERFHARLMPGNLSIAYLYDAQTGAQLGRMERVDAPRFGDAKAQERALGEVQHYRSLITREVNATHAPDREANREAGALNRSILAAARAGRVMVEETARIRSAKKQDTATRQRNATRMAQLANSAREQFNASTETL